MSKAKDRRAPGRDAQDGPDKGGRPEVEISIEQLAKLASYGCTQEEAAHFFGCSVSTIKNRLKDEAYRAAWDQGLAAVRIALRKDQLRLAKRNATMAIFLGKQLLGQKDRHDHALMGADGGPVRSETMVQAAEPASDDLSDEQLTRLYLEKASAAGRA